MSLQLVVVGWALVSEMALGAADHAEVVLAMMFLFFWEELAIGAEDFAEVRFFGLGCWGG